jgi:hypothetical protein
VNEVRNRVTFATALFNATAVRDYFINDCCFGDDCAAWLIEKLKEQRDLQVDTEAIQEDWGWCLGEKVGPRSFLVGGGLYEDDDVPNRWLVFIDSQLGSVKRMLFGQADQVEHRAVCEAIDRVLKGELEINDIRWYSKAGFESGLEDAWRSGP